MTEPPEVKLDNERITYWLEQGAKPSDTVKSLLQKNG
jgi:small subunit ribosomal protein S16